MNVKTVIVAVVLAVVATQAIQVISYNHDSIDRATKFINVGNTPPPKQPPLACMVLRFLCPDMMTM